MESFKNFFECLENVQDTFIRGHFYLEGEDDPQEETTVDIFSNGVTEEYFENVDRITNLLMQFYEYRIATTPVHNALYDQAMLNKRRNYDDLKLCMLIDVLRCYEGLNHPMSLDSKEGLGLLLLLVKMYSQGTLIAYENLSKISTAVINMDALIPYAFAASSEINFPENSIIVSSLLQQVNAGLDVTYRTLLYRFCEAVSQADGEISRAEKEWLMTILRLDDEDTSNDINIDSIFA